MKISAMGPVGLLVIRPYCKLNKDSLFIVLRYGDRVLIALLYKHQLGIAVSHIHYFRNSKNYESLTDRSIFGDRARVVL